MIYNTIVKVNHFFLRSFNSLSRCNRTFGIFPWYQGAISGVIEVLLISRE